MNFGRLFTYVLCLLGLGYGWLNPFVGLMIYYVFAILRPEFLWFWAFPEGGGKFSFYVAISTLAGWVMSGLGDFSRLRGVFFPMAGLIVYVLCGVGTAAFVAPVKEAAWQALEIQYKIVLMAVVTFSIVRTAGQIRIFAWLLTACLGYLGWVFNSQSFFDGWDRLTTKGFGGIDNNGAAMIMVMGVPLCFFVALSNRRWWVKGLCLVGTACLINTVLLSKSRGGMLGLCMVGGLLFLVALFRLPNKGVTILLVVVFLGLTYRLAGPETVKRFNTIFVGEDNLDASAASRFKTWGAAWACIQDHPMGVGPRNFNFIAKHYGLNDGKSVHNLFLQTGADYGILGALGMIVFYLGTAWNTFWAARLPAAGRLVWPRYYCHMVTIALAGFLVCSTFIGMESVETGYLISIMGLCTVAYLHRVSETEATAEQGPLPELEQVPAREEEGEGLVAG